MNVNGSAALSRMKEAEFRLDRICRQFEQAWRQKRAVTIEHCLNQVAEGERAHLLEELIASEWELRVRCGEEPEAGEYLARFPQDEELVAGICGVLAAECNAAAGRSTQTTPQPGDHLGDYKIIREVGRGGMGIVYEARQESLGRQVALKVLPARRFRSERELHRFRREAQAVARLHHSHIVEIYGVGEQDGVHYFAMRYVTGRGLERVIADLRERLGLVDDAAETSVLKEPQQARHGSLSSIHTSSSLLLSRALTSLPDSIDSTTASSRFRAAARIGIQVAEALQYAHERGIQHRDVKPSNLLIDRHEVVWLSDFGLAKLDLDAVDITESDDLIGTLKYMPPEALTGKIDHRSDIYSLGLTLYELVTLRPALDGSDRAQLLEQVKDPQVAAPRWLVPDIPRDLETIILKAMAADLDQRYQTASELAADLERFLNREPIRARPQSLLTKFRRWVERKPLMAFLALGTLSITSTSVFSFGALYINALATAKQAKQDRDLAKQLLKVAERAKTLSEISRKAAEISTREAQNRLIQAQRAEAAAYLQQGDDFAALVWTAETLRSENRLSSTGDAVDSQVESIAANRRGTLDAAGYLNLEPTLRLRVGAILEGAPRILLREWLPRVAPELSGPPASPEGFAPSPQVSASAEFFPIDPGERGDRYLWIANADRTRIRRWNLRTGRTEALAVPDTEGPAVFSMSGKFRVRYGSGQTLQYWRAGVGDQAEPRTLADPPSLRPLELHRAWESLDERLLLVTFMTEEGEVVAGLWDLEHGQLAHPRFLPLRGNPIHAEFSDDSRRLYWRSDEQVQVVELLGGASLLPEERFEAGASDWTRNGRWFAGWVAGETQIYDLNAGGASFPQIFETPEPEEIYFQNDGGWLALRLPRGRVAFYKQTAEQTFSFQDSVHPHEIDAQGFAYSPDGQWYALAHEDGNVRVWNIHTHQPWTGILRHPGAVRSLCWSPGGDLLATQTQDGLLTVWDMTSRATGQTFFHPAGQSFTSVRFSPDGRQVAVAGDGGPPAVWDARTGSVSWTPQRDGPAMLEGIRDVEAADRGWWPRLIWSADGSWLGTLSSLRDRAPTAGGALLRWNVWETEYGLRIPFEVDDHRLHPGTPVDVLRPQLTRDRRLLVPEAGRASLVSWAGGEAVRRFMISQHAFPLLVELAPESDRLAVLDSEGNIGLYSSNSGAALLRWRVPAGGAVAALRFNVQGTLLAAGGTFGLQVWRTDTGELQTPPVAGAIPVRQVCFSPDGQHVATVSQHHVCQIRSTTTWDWRGGGFQLESKPVLAEFNPRDNTFITATEAGTVQTWDWSRGEPLTPPFRYARPLSDAHLSADGKRIAIVGGDSLHVWELPEPNEMAPEKIAAWAREVALTDVNTADGTLVPLLPYQFPPSRSEITILAEISAAERLRVRCRWHRHQAAAARLLSDVNAEKFHRTCLEALDPECTLRSTPLPDSSDQPRPADRLASPNRK